MGKSLQQLGEEFRNWRNQCKHPGRVPESLKAQVVDSLQKHTKSQVSLATSLLESTLDKWQQQHTLISPLQEPVTPSESSPFISLYPMFETDNTDKTKLATVEGSRASELKIMLPNGLQAIISGHSIAQTSSLILLLAKEVE